MSLRKHGIVGTAIIAAAATTAALVPGAGAVSTTPGERAPTTASTVTAAQAAPDGRIDSRVRGDFGRNGTVRGTFDPKRFVVKRGDVYAVGMLHATLRRGNGNLVGRPDRQIVIPLKNGRVDAAGLAAKGRSCQVLDLVLGPLNLNLLGLRVHLNRVVLVIEALPGAGALLGNLLCAVAGLLDGPGGLLQQLRLSNLLNRILSILRA